jgi:hypothetical protein
VSACGHSFVTGPDGTRVSVVRGSTTSGPDGRFHLRWEEPDNSFVLVRAAGFGLALAAPAVGEGEEVELALVPAAGIAGRVLAAPPSGLVVHAKARSADLVVLGDPSMVGNWTETASARPAADGSFGLTRLPSRVPLEIAVSDEETGRVLFVERDVVLEPGEVRDLELDLRSRGAIAGIVRDPSEQPVADAEVTLAPSDPERTYVYPWEGAVRETARTDGEGRFAFRGLDEGRWQVAAAPISASGWIAELATVEVLPPSAAEAVLRYRAGLWIEGRVLDTEERGLAGASVTGQPTGQSGGVHTRADETGHFRLGPLLAGTHRVWASVGGLHLRSPESRIEPSADDVVFVLEPAGGIRGVVIDDRTGRPCTAAVWIYDRAEEHNGSATAAQWDGSWSADGLRPGVCTLVARGPDRLLGVREDVDVRAGVWLEDIEIRVRETPLLEVENRRGQPESFRVLRHGITLGWGTLAPGESMLVPCLPGEVTVESDPLSTVTVGESGVHPVALQ